ncbi:hypothetical protein [Ktedonobacter racemifer]|uniref:Uncharacterized protein n=1 Tax=Ktedonobacter racemifer DSM 44963 TaxID=485913 RepID=D6U3X8_KTERA|nr:hypothetical protein [Ktedonobacter racemifer]EFH81216.1 hypothetical protein Krac_1918 [Ktedonobacter racemifer DSM 44963]
MKPIQFPPDQPSESRICILRYDIRESEEKEAQLLAKIEKLKAEIYDLQQQRKIWSETLANLEAEKAGKQAAS